MCEPTRFQTVAGALLDDLIIDCGIDESVGLACTHTLALMESTPNASRYRVAVCGQTT